MANELLARLSKKWLGAVSEDIKSEIRDAVNRIGEDAKKKVEDKIYTAPKDYVHYHNGKKFKLDPNSLHKDLYSYRYENYDIIGYTISFKRHADDGFLGDVAWFLEYGWAGFTGRRFFTPTVTKAQADIQNAVTSIIYK